MDTNIIINYIAPFLIVNGISNYVFQKNIEKKVIENFSFDQKNILLKDLPDQLIIPDILKKYTKKLESEFDNKSLENLYRNISNVQINKKIILILRGLAGSYITSENKINYSIESALSHEFIHMASSCYDKDNNISKSGFLDFNEKAVFGRSLNEGYTELLNKRYLNPKSSGYNEEVYIVKFFELLFDNKELENFYFTNDFISIIKILKKYMTIEEAINLISNFDLGFKLKYNFNPAYLPIYINIKSKLADIFIKNNHSLLKQLDYLVLLNENPLINTIQNVNLILNKKNYSLTKSL
ncbi:MAG: hypothetical protein WCR93_03970 [Bacilli bacterium]